MNDITWQQHLAQAPAANADPAETQEWRDALLSLAADLFETGFNHFFHTRNEVHGGDLVSFQPHSAPGVWHVHSWKSA